MRELVSLASTDDDEPFTFNAEPTPLTSLANRDVCIGGGLHLAYGLYGLHDKRDELQQEARS